MNENLLTPAEVAERLNISRSKVKQMRIDGDGPEPVRIGYRTVRYRASDVEAWLASR